MNIKKLPESELEIMQVLWDAEGAVYRNHFDRQLKDTKHWTDSTILSLLSRLQEKGFLRCTKDGNRNVYEAVITKAEYLAYEDQHFLHAFHKNSIRHLVASMVASNDLTDEDLNDLEAYLEERKKGG